MSVFGLYFFTVAISRGGTSLVAPTVFTNVNKGRGDRRQDEIAKRPIRTDRLDLEEPIPIPRYHGGCTL